MLPETLPGAARTSAYHLGNSSHAGRSHRVRDIGMPICFDFDVGSSKNHFAWFAAWVLTLFGHCYSSCDLQHCDVVWGSVQEGQDHPLDDHILHDQLHRIDLHDRPLFSR